MTERRFRPSFRTRVLGSFVALVAGATSIGLVVQRAVLLERLDAEVDSTLAQERTELAALSDGRDPLTGQPFAGDVRAIFDTFLERNVPLEGEVFVTYVGGRPYKSTRGPVRLDRIDALTRSWAELRAGERGELDSAGGRVRYLAVPLRFAGETEGVFVVANFLQGERDQIDSTLRVAAAVAAGILLVSTVIAWGVAGRLMRPIRQLSDAAEAITDTDLDARIPVEGDDELARLTMRFNQMLDRLAAAFEAQRTFVDDAGHELRTPITIVRGHLEVMGDGPEERAATMVVVTDELDRMARIVDDLLLLAKAERPDFCRPEVVEAADLTADLMAKCRALGDRTWLLDGTAAGELVADRQRVAQAVLNLARNAVEHTAPGAEVALGSGWGTDGLRIWVRDTGPGVDPAERDRIFARFARGRSSRRRSEGAGLGLAIVRSVAEAHGGRVELDSRPGEGSTFTIVLPGAPPPELTDQFPVIDPIGGDDDTVEIAVTKGPFP